MNDDIEQFVRQAFEENFEQLRAESGHALSPDVRAAALEEVLLYSYRLRDLAERITDTEVRLNLPNQRTPKDRKFGIEGVVDIIREETRTTMYDIKTHDPELIRQNIGLYQDQLNIYAHIWHKLRGQQLTDTAVVSTHVPDSVKGAFRSGNAEQLAKAMEQWEPVIPIEFDPDNVETTIKDFGDVVDKIEGGKFSSPSVAKLRKLGGKRTFGDRVCGNCDVRFSCKAYREYADAPRRKDSARFSRYYSPLADDAEREGWRDAAVPEVASGADALEDI